MSIADRISSMSSNLSSAYGRIAYLGVDTSSIDKNMQNLSTVLDTVYNDYPKVSDEGTSPSLSGTKVGRLSSTLKGNTSQDGTPTPDNPVDINVVKGENSITVCGKNLCDGINQNIFLNIAVNQCGSNIGDTGLYIKTNGETYTISTITTQTRYRVGCTINQPSSTTQIAYGGVNKDGTSDSITIDTSGYNYLIVNATDLTKIQIEKGSTATTYKSYTGITLPITLPAGMELCEIGDYQDYIYRELGNWYLYKAIGRVVLNGSSTEGIYYMNNNDVWDTQNSGYTHFQYPLLTVYHNNVDAIRIVDNYFPSVDIAHRDLSAEQIFAHYLNGVISITIKEDRLQGISSSSTSEEKKRAFNTWLSTHNVIIYYQTETPTTTQITDTTLINQLNALYNAMSYNGQTNILQTNADLPFIISASALKGV